MNSVFAGMLYHGIVFYVDDLVTYGMTFDDQMFGVTGEGFQEVCKLKLKTSKCYFITPLMSCDIQCQLRVYNLWKEIYKLYVIYYVNYVY